MAAGCVLLPSVALVMMAWTSTSASLALSRAWSKGADGACAGPCGGSGPTPGYNVGYGINDVGNQQIDPATGYPVVCQTVYQPTGPAKDLDTSSVYVRGSWKATDSLVLLGEVQRERLAARGAQRTCA